MLTPEQAEARFQSALAAIAASEVVWVLDSPGGLALLSSDDDEEPALPVFDSEGAANALKGSFATHEPRPVSLAEFVERVAPMLASREIWVMPNPDEATLGGVAVPIDAFLEQLETGTS